MIGNFEICYLKEIRITCLGFIVRVPCVKAGTNVRWSFQECTHMLPFLLTPTSIRWFVTIHYCSYYVNKSVHTTVTSGVQSWVSVATVYSANATCGWLRNAMLPFSALTSSWTGLPLYNFQLRISDLEQKLRESQMQLQQLEAKKLRFSKKGSKTRKNTLKPANESSDEVGQFHAILLLYIETKADIKCFHLAQLGHCAW